MIYNNTIRTCDKALFEISESKEIKQAVYETIMKQNNIDILRSK